MTFNPKNIADRMYQNFVQDSTGRPAQVVAFADSFSGDAFGRQRVSNPRTLLDTKQLGSNLPLFFDDQEVSGSGTSSTFSANKASSTLAVTASTAGKRVRQSFQRFNYQPGKSLLCFQTCQFIDSTSDVTGITSEVGAFDDNDGIFFSYDDGVLYAVIRSNVSGTPTDTRIAQADFNVDPLDGTGNSGITFDPTKVQIVWFDYEWLGVGRVRMGFVKNGVPLLAHQFLFANINTTVYMSRPNLPFRWSIENDGNGGARSMQAICCSASAEGGLSDNGVLHHVSNGTTEVTATTGGTTYALLGIRLNSSFLYETVNLVDVSILLTSAGTFEWMLLFNPTVDNTFTYSQVTNSGVDRAIGTSNNSISALGTVISGGYGSSTGSGGAAAGTAGKALEDALHLGSAIDGTQDTIVLAVRALANGETFLGGLTYRELN